MYRIAETFNKEFEEVARLKLAEIARIREKNVRISKIIQQLQLTEEQLVQPVLQPVEQPEEMLTVQVWNTLLTGHTVMGGGCCECLVLCVG